MSETKSKGRSSSALACAQDDDNSRRCRTADQRSKKHERPPAKDTPERTRNRKCKQALPNKGSGVSVWKICLTSGCALVLLLLFSALMISSQQADQQQGFTATTSQLNIPVTGQWQMDVATGSNSLPGTIFLKQETAAVYGQGQDAAGAFTIEGKLLPDRISFIKRYDEESRHRGAHPQDIVFDGTVSVLLDNSLCMQGQYETQVKSGFATSYFKKPQWQTVTGSWCARRTGELPYQMQLEKRQEAWNPLKNLDVQPSLTSAIPDATQSDPIAQAQNKKRQDAILFFTFIVPASFALFGCSVLFFMRYLKQHDLV